jgi:hypothetical protein
MTLGMYQTWVFEFFLRIMIMNCRRRPDNCLGLLSVAGSKAHLTLGVRADVQPKIASTYT